MIEEQILNSLGQGKSDYPKLNPDSVEVLANFFTNIIYESSTKQRPTAVNKRSCILVRIYPK